MSGIKTEQIPMRNAMNEVTRGSYVTDCELGLKRWNRLIEKAGYSFRLSLPSTRFRRNIGTWAGIPTDTTGRPITQEEFNARRGELAAERERPGLHHEPDARRARAGQDGRLDRASRPRHQQQPGGLRVRAVALR